jgi:hypothetical protein
MIPTIPRSAVNVLVVAALVAIAAGGMRFRENLAVARNDAAAARAATLRAVRRAEVANAVAVDAQHAAADAMAQSLDAQHRADVQIRNAARVRSTFTAAVVPDTCRQLVALADSVIASQDSAIRNLHVALQHAEDGEHRLSAALDTATAALTQLRAASTTLVHADANLAKASKRSFFARLLPHPGLGIAAGPDALGHPHIITGITLGWSL